MQGECVTGKKSLTLFIMISHKLVNKFGDNKMTNSHYVMILQKSKQVKWCKTKAYKVIKPLCNILDGVLKLTFPVVLSEFVVQHLSTLYTYIGTCVFKTTKTNKKPKN